MLKINRNNNKKKSGKKEKKKSFTLKTLGYVLKLTWKKKPMLFFAYLLQLIAEVVRTMIMVILPKYIMDDLVEIVGGRPFSELKNHLFWIIGSVIAIYGICSLLISVCNAVRQSLGEWFNRYLEKNIAEHSMRMDFEYTEDPDVLDKQNKAKEGVGWYSGGVEGILAHFYAIIMNVTVLVGVITIVVVGCPWLLPIQFISLLLVTYFNYRNNQIEIKSFQKQSKLNRRFGYFFYGLADFRYGKDIRLYDSVDMMSQKSDIENQKMKDVWSDRMKKTRHNSWGSDIVNSFRDGASYFYLGFLAITKTITIGEFTMYTSSAGTFFWSLYHIVEGVQEITKRCHYFHEYVTFLDYKDTMKQGTSKIQDCDHVIEFRDVSFKYPRGKNYILRHINLTIQPGEHLSIVGLNGAGKTTFIKLLCRLYDVTEGAILVDGCDIRDYPVDEYRKLLTVVFQDFQLFAFTLRENVSLDAAETADEKAIEHALSLSGVYDDAVKLEQGIDTIIYKSFDKKGTELSGGQKQKVAISRALYRNAPIVILDEPTAALDPVAEYEIYRKFDELVGGKTALYISHRLSSCKFCDHIAVFSGQGIGEYGTHEELVSKENGIYAEMFQAQAQYYV